MADPTLLPEPPNGAYVLAGEVPDEQVYRRGDSLEPDDPWRWWLLIGDEADPVTWHEVCHVLTCTDDGALQWRPRPVQRLWLSGEETEEAGGHTIRLATGRCECHGRTFDPIELERLRGKEAGDG